MVIFLSALLVLLALLFFKLSAAFKKSTRHLENQITSLYIENCEWRDKYRALEKGADEQQESFEQEYLTFDETRKALEDLREVSVARESYISTLEDEVERHRRDCLPNLAHADSIDV
jgi:hypothetical protein